jgi:hypothetical protein
VNAALITALLLVFAALLGAWRTLRAPSHRAVRIALQCLGALLLYLALFPPMLDERFAANTLVVLTPGISEQAAASASGSTIVGLPGTPARGAIERVPDLGTALRRHPGTTELRVLGGGLPARDLDAARDLAIEFDASPLPNGIVELTVPSSVRAGSVWTVSGRVEGHARGRVELRDPADAVIAHVTVGDDGSFALSAQAKAAGTALFALHVFDAAGVPVEDLPLAIAAQDGEALRVMLLAGAPDPDLKYWRRWAVDAGIQLGSRMALSDGVAMQDGAAALTRTALDQADIVVVDERAWAALDANAKTLLEAAVREGLGLLLRITGPVPDAVAADWQTLGFRIRAADVALTVTLPAASGRSDSNIALSRRAVNVEADDAAPLLQGSDGAALALWRSERQGRIAVWWLADSYRLGLGGDAGRFGTLWSGALSTIARARGAASPDLPVDARIDQRSAFCGISNDAAVEQADGKRIRLIIDAASASRRCAAYWPTQAGWQTLVSGQRRWPFHVRAADDGRALAAAEAAASTRAMAGRDGAGSSSSTRQIPAPRWPFFIVWLVLVAALWWLERGSAAGVESAS